jgi:DnaJ domain
MAGKAAFRRFMEQQNGANDEHDGKQSGRHGASSSSSSSSSSPKPSEPSFRTHDLEDFYGVLNVHEHATLAQIVAEFKVACRQVHPDRRSAREQSGGNENVADDFVRLRRAYEVLSDTEKRKLYDAYRSSRLSISFDNYERLQEHARICHWATPKQQMTIKQ